MGKEIETHNGLVVLPEGLLQEKGNLSFSRCVGVQEVPTELLPGE